MNLAISVLGQFQAFLEGKPLAYFRTKKAQALLVYLLVEGTHHPGAAHQREALMELLWPGLPLNSAQENLRQTLYQLRKALVGVAGESADTFLVANRQDIQVDPEFKYDLDSARFMRLFESSQRVDDPARQRRLEEAASLYSGDFLSDFFLVDSTNFEEWASRWRSRLQDMALKTLGSLATFALNNAEYAQAEAYALRQLEIDPFSEAVTLQLIQALALQGKRAAALTRFEDYQRSLSQEFNLQPGTSLLEFVEAVRQKPDFEVTSTLQEVPGRPGSQSSAPFFARQVQLELLQNYLNAVLTSQPRVVFITGEAGTGKTALLHEFARRAQQAIPGLLALKGTGNAITGAGDPYLPFRQAIGRWINYNQLDLELNEPGSLNSRDLFLERYTHLLRRLSEKQPLLLLLDDLQWADRASINLLFHLGRELDGVPILILGTYRPSDLVLGLQPGTNHGQTHPLNSVVNELGRKFGDIQVNLDKFSIDEGRSLVDAYLDHVETFQPNHLGEDFRRKLFWKTRGHPLFIVELLQEMVARHDLLRNQQGYWVESPGLDWDILPAKVGAVIQQRISRLDPDLLELLSIASLEGEEFTVQVVGGVAGLDDQTAFRALSHELDKRHGLVREYEELEIGQVVLSRYQFSHALFQQFLSEQLNPGEKRLLHGKIGAILERIQGQDGETFTLQLAHHYSQAGNGRKAVFYLLKAGDKTRTLYANEEASRHYQAAIEILLDLGDQEGAAHAWMKLGLTHHSAFDFEQAHQAYARGFQLWQQMAKGAALASNPSAPHPLRLAWRDPTTLDPSFGGTNLTAPIVTQLFSGLVNLSPDMEVIPDIASSWDLLEEGRKYVFHLRQDVTWSDGQPVTAADFEFTYKRALDPATNAPVAAMLLDGLLGARDFRLGKSSDPDQVGVYAADDYTLVIELEEPVSYFLQQLTYYVLLPVPKHCVQAFGMAWSEPENIVTNGPFMLAEWTREESMRLERYSHYHGRFHGNLQGVDLALGLSEGDQFERYKAGRQDILMNWFIGSAHMADIINQHPGELHARTLFVTHYLILNPHKPPFDDQRVRRAFSLAIDRLEFSHRGSKGYDLPATGGFIPPGMPGHDPNAGLGYDPLRARQLLVSAGLNDSPELHLDLLTYPQRENLAYLLIDGWRNNLQLDIDLALRPTERFMSDYFKIRPPLTLAGWWADYADPENFLRVCVQMDLPDWHNLQYEHLLEEARRTTDQNLRIEIYREADRILMEDAVIIPLVYAQGLSLAKPWVKNYHALAVKHPGFWKDLIIEAH
jgi:ABC-type oligopeptide transport system substrate-binding subunit/DNA-binding SARP family transcriptional activator